MTQYDTSIHGLTERNTNLQQSIICMSACCSRQT